MKKIFRKKDKIEKHPITVLLEKSGSTPEKLAAYLGLKERSIYEMIKRKGGPERINNAYINQIKEFLVPSCLIPRIKSLCKVIYTLLPAEVISYWHLLYDTPYLPGAVKDGVPIVLFRNTLFSSFYREKYKGAVPSGFQCDFTRKFSSDASLLNYCLQTKEYITHYSKEEIENKFKECYTEETPVHNNRYVIGDLVSICRIPLHIRSPIGPRALSCIAIDNILNIKKLPFYEDYKKILFERFKIGSQDIDFFEKRIIWRSEFSNLWEKVNKEEPKNITK